MPDKVKKIVDDYVGSNGKHQFPLAIQETDYQLPEYSLDDSTDIDQKNKQWLDQLFDILNKGACRHRVMALANKFQQANLVNGQDFIIVGVNNNHILLEVKNNDDSWITLDLGGSNAQLNYSSDIYKSSKITSCDSSNESDVDRTPTPNQKSTPFPKPSSSPTNPQAKMIVEELKIVRDQLNMLYQLQEFQDFNHFKHFLTSFVKDREKNSLLLKTNYCEELKNYLLGFNDPNELVDSSESDKSTNQAIKAHFIGSSQDMEITKPTIKLQDQVSISPNTALWQFIETAKKNSQKKHFLIIDWQKFDDKSRVAFNTMFDKGNRSINGVNIPSNVAIICLDDKTPITDPAVLSRFEDAYNLSSTANDHLSSSTSQDTIPPIEFDGEGEENWQAKLLGRLVINDRLIEFRKSQFTTTLESLIDKSKGVKFKFKNFSAEQQTQISILFAQAKAQGFIDYHGDKINFPKNYSLQFDRTEFNFAEILQSFNSPDKTYDSGHKSKKLNLVIHKNSQPTDADDFEIVNSYLFDQLLAIPEITDDKYQLQQGRIARAKDKTLKLFITEQITPAQLYCILFNAKQYQVSLELYLAKDVKFGDQAFMKFDKALQVSRSDSLIRDHKKEVIADLASRITVTNNVELEFNNLEQLLRTSTYCKDKSINIVNIEDVLFSDLFSKTEHAIYQDDQSKHFTFEQKISEVIKKIKDQEIVILKGKFPKDLLSLLHPQILDLKTRYPNLYFIIEEEISSASKVSTQLAWLDNQKYSISFHQKQALQKNRNSN